MGHGEDDFSQPSELLENVDGGKGRRRIWAVWPIIIICLGLVAGSISSFFLFSASHLPDTVPHPLATGTARPQALSVTPMLLDFGKVEVGAKAVLAVSIANHGPQALNWQADVGRTAWLTGVPSTGTIAPAGNPQLIYTTADARKLAVGSYLGVEHVQSNVGATDVSVKITVVPAGAKKTAHLQMSPDTLDFGGLLQGQRVRETLLIGNTGRGDLHWMVNIGGAPKWLTSDPISGAVLAGDVPQPLTVTVDTTNLAPGNYSTTLNVTSNGSNMSVGVTLTVQPARASSGTPALSLSPNATSPMLVVGATSTALSTVVTTASTTISSAKTTSIVVTTTASATSSKTTGSVSASTGIGGGSTTSTSSTVVVIAGASAGTAKNTPTPTPTATATPTATSTPVLTPHLSVSPLNLSPQVCPSNKDSNGKSDGTYTCTVTVSEDVSGTLYWQVSSALLVTYEVVGIQGPQPNIQSGMLTPNGTSAELLISGLTCSNPGEFDFSSDTTNSTIVVQWACPAG